MAVPTFNQERFESYLSQIKAWRVLCGLPAKEQGVLLWYTLPDDHPSDIKDKIMDEIGLEALQVDTGVDVFIEKMEACFKTEKEMKAYEIYREFFSDMKKKPEETIKDFINRFEKAANVAAKFKMGIPPTVKALKILDDAGLTDDKRMLVMSEINFKGEEKEIFEEAKVGLVKYLTATPSASKGSDGITLDAALVAKVEEGLMARGWVPHRGGYQGGGGGAAAGAGRGSRPSKRGGWSGQGKPEQKKKPENPKDNDGNFYLCISCGSYRHMLDTCPHKWENLESSKVVSTEEEAAYTEEETFFTSGCGVPKTADCEDIILYTGRSKEKASGLCRETLGCLVLDCGCTSNVCGELWLDSYLTALSEEDTQSVKEVVGEKMKRFRFGGDEVLSSLKVMSIPAVLAGRKVQIKTHVVSSTIPLLWSRPSMKKAGVVLDLPGDRAQVFGSWVDLDLTTVGHYALPILPSSGRQAVVLEVSLMTLPEVGEEDQLEAVLLKIHRQFGHPSIATEENLLKKASKWKKEMTKMLEKIHGSCRTCKLFSKVPPRPVVALPAASEFNQVITMDLKEVKIQAFKYILHLIDGFTRLSVSVFLRNKQATTIISEFMKNWVAVGYGCPARCWTDVGGEFSNDMVRQLGEAIGCKMETGAGYAGWMNGLCERNHSVIDRCFEKILTEHPSMDPQIALAWAVNAKNSFPMFGGYSSYTLVFGKNPNMPGFMQDKLPALCGVTTSETVATHIKAMCTARKAFTTALCDDRIRAALRHKVRAVERPFQQGEEVFYRREGDSHRWRGPATVLGSKGTVHFLVHQGQVLRVSSCRMVSTGEAGRQMDLPPGLATKAGQEGCRDGRQEQGTGGVSPGAGDNAYTDLIRPQADGGVDAPPIDQGMGGLPGGLTRLAATQQAAAQKAGQAAAGQAAAGQAAAGQAGVGQAAAGQAGARQTTTEKAAAGQAAAGQAAAGQTAAGQTAAGQTTTEMATAQQAAGHEGQDLQFETETARQGAGAGGSRRGDRRMYPKSGEKIQVKVGEVWKDMDVIGRGGKSSSKVNKDYFNLRSEEDKLEGGMHLDKETWRFDNVRKEVTETDEDVEELDEVTFITLIPSKEHWKPECVAAKDKELKKWVEFDAVEEVQDRGQDTVSHRWVLVEKVIEGQLGVKARLCARGFEEMIQVQADSPTGRKETFHLLLALAASKGWDIKTIDVQNAYLQGENLTREIYMEPPPEAKVQGKIWKLKKAVYGINDAGRRWYFRVGRAMQNIGWEQSKLDSCFFFHHKEDSLDGLVILWVDDFFLACSAECEKKVTADIEAQFRVGNREANSFIYTGLQIRKTKAGIELDQHHYISTLQPALLSRKSPKISPLDKSETTLLKRLTGKVNWAATQTRPDLAFNVVELSIKYKAPTLEDLSNANKAIAKLITNPVTLLFPKLSGELQLVVWSDAAFRNLPDQISSGRGHIIFLKGSQSGQNVAPVAWNSNKVKRVVGSTIAAEALSLLMGMDHAYYLRAILAEVLKKEQTEIKIISFIDSNNLYEAVFSTSLVEDKKLRCDIAQIQENVNKENVELRWVPGSEMLADCLTKKTASSAGLLEVLSTAKLKATI